MMRKILILISWLWIAVCTAAQTKQGRPVVPLLSGDRLAKSVVVDVGHLRVYYAFNATDVADRSSYIDLQCLDVGQNLSKYYSRWVETADSLKGEWRQQHPYAEGAPIWLGEGGRQSEYWSEYQFTELFREKGKLTAYARMPMYYEEYDCRYEEPYPLQQWHIEADTLTVCGYLCQKATCTFRGRNFVAWFTADIPVNDGPWKFGGLPGLILKLYDSDRYYTFECVQIMQGRFPIRKYDYGGYRQMNRTRLLKLQRKINENYLGNGGAIDMKTGKRLSHFTPYEPLELE